MVRRMIVNLQVSFWKSRTKCRQLISLRVTAILSASFTCIEGTFINTVREAFFWFPSTQGRRNGRAMKQQTSCSELTAQCVSAIKKL